MRSADEPSIEVLPSPAAVVLAADQLFRATAAQSIAERGRFTVALSGGRTPNDLYRSLTTTTPDRAPLDWTRVHLFWGDERCVPPDHADSNYHNAMAALAGAAIPSDNVHRIAAETVPPESGAAAYESMLRSFFYLAPGTLPAFDLVLLGLGPDGHTASLFPGSSALDEHERLVAATWVSSFHTHRITLTYPVLDAARQVVFLVTGTEKAEIARRLLRERDPALPSAHVRPTTGELIFLLDAEAAARL
ncbi:MAG: 6-phosphogluconolactonase [Acidobacteriota bacterium]